MCLSMDFNYGGPLLDAVGGSGWEQNPPARRAKERAEEHYRAGIAHRQAEDFDLAGQHFLEAVAIDPVHARAHGELAGMLFADGKIEQAVAEITKAIELTPNDGDFQILLAVFLEADRKTDRALEIVNHFLASGNESKQLALLYARMAPALHLENEALEFVTRVLDNRQPRTARDLASLHFSAAFLLDRLGRYDEAFSHAERANSLRGVSYNPAQVERPIREWISYFDRPTLRRLPHATHGSELPVFVVGMPRSGTTLIEQILSSHPQVHGAGELRWLFNVCQSLALRHPSATMKLSESFDRLSINDVDELADEYLRPLEALAPHAARIINKLPTNFMHLGMVKLLFPMARVIYCRRDPLDTCLSCYMTDFAGGHDYSNALQSLAHYFQWSQGMMEHWKAVLDLSILEVRYEDVVDDLEGQTRRMVEFLDLPWDDRCLRFHENKRFVATASNEQVRLPIYKSSLGRWRHYQRHLGPLIEEIGAIGASSGGV